MFGNTTIRYSPWIGGQEKPHTNGYPSMSGAERYMNGQFPRLGTNTSMESSLTPSIGATIGRKIPYLQLKYYCIYSSFLIDHDIIITCLCSPACSDAVQKYHEEWRSTDRIVSSVVYWRYYPFLTLLFCFNHRHDQNQDIVLFSFPSALLLESWHAIEVSVQGVRSLALPRKGRLNDLFATASRR